MSTDGLRQFLGAARAGRTDGGAPLGQPGRPPVAALGFPPGGPAPRARWGVPEVIFCEGKAAGLVGGGARRVAEGRQGCLGTRVSAEEAAHLTKAFPQAEQDRLARTFWLPV